MKEVHLVLLLLVEQYVMCDDVVILITPNS